MTTEPPVLCEIDARGVATVRLNRPHRNNAYNGEMLQGLLDGVAALAADSSVRVIIYNGAGTPGIAGQAAQQLIAAGMRVVDTKNADRFD